MEKRIIDCAGVNKYGITDEQFKDPSKFLVRLD
jgi:hypothetical protein